jgi:hypothetical protein
MPRLVISPLTIRLAAVLAVLVSGAALWAYPTPSPVPYRWELDFKPGDLRMYTDRSGQSYWYFDYEVINRTQRTQTWAPQITLYTDAGEIMLAGRDVPKHVESEIVSLLGNPLLERQIQVVGDLLVGRENAKDGLAIWPARIQHVNELSLFVRGCSGESARVRNPISGQREVLYKTLQRDFVIPGDAIQRGNEPIEMASQRWVLR